MFANQNQNQSKSKYESCFRLQCAIVLLQYWRNEKIQLTKKYLTQFKLTFPKHLIASYHGLVITRTSPYAFNLPALILTHDYLSNR